MFIFWYVFLVRPTNAAIPCLPESSFQSKKFGSGPLQCCDPLVHRLQTMSLLLLPCSCSRGSFAQRTGSLRLSDGPQYLGMTFLHLAMTRDGIPRAVLWLLTLCWWRLGSLCSCPPVAFLRHLHLEAWNLMTAAGIPSPRESFASPRSVISWFSRVERAFPWALSRPLPVWLAFALQLLFWNISVILLMSDLNLLIFKLQCVS